MPSVLAASSGAAARRVDSKLLVLLFIGACFSWPGVNIDAFQNTYEQPYLSSKNASLQDFAAVSSIEDIPWSSKILFAIPLDAGYCCSRVFGHTLGLRRPMIFVGQVLASSCMALNLVVDPVSAKALYQFLAFVRQLGAVFVAIAIEGSATDASMAVFAGREALPAAAFQIGRNFGAAVGLLAGGKLLETSGFTSLFLLFMGLMVATMPLTFCVRELRPVPSAELAVSASLKKLLPLRLIIAWILRPPVLSFLLIFCTMNTGFMLGTVFLVRFWTETRATTLYEVGQLSFLNTIIALCTNAPAAYLIDRYAKGRFLLTVVFSSAIVVQAAVVALPLATQQSAAGKPALFAIQVLAGIALSVLNVLYFALLLRLADKRFSATAFSLVSMITNAFGGPVPKQIAIQILNSAGDETAGIIKCMWLGAIICACAALACPLLVLPSVEAQHKMDGGGDGEGATPTDADGSGASGTPASLADKSEAENLQLNPLSGAAMAALGRRERVVAAAKLAGLAVVTDETEALGEPATLVGASVAGAAGISAADAIADHFT